MGCLKLTYQKNNLEVIKNYFKKELTSKNSSKNDYSYLLFGKEQPGRQFNANSYKYSFNGKEDDTEWGNGLQDYGFRIYSKDLGKFLSVDPLSPDYPYYTPYQFSGNMPIWAIDLDGLEEFIVIQEVGQNTRVILDNEAPFGRTKLISINKQEGKKRTQRIGSREMGRVGITEPFQFGNFSITGTLNSVNQVFNQMETISDGLIATEKAKTGDVNTYTSTNNETLTIGGKQFIYNKTITKVIKTGKVQNIKVDVVIEASNITSTYMTNLVSDLQATGKYNVTLSQNNDANFVGATTVSDPNNVNGITLSYTVDSDKESDTISTTKTINSITNVETGETITDNDDI